MSQSFSFEGIGTQWEIEIYSPITVLEIGYLEHIIKKRVEEYEHVYSRFRPDSFVNSSLLQKGIVRLPSDSEKLFSLYKQLYTVTDGAFTPLIGQVLIDAGYDAAYSLKSKELHSPPPWEEVAEYIFPHMIVKNPAVFDFGAAGKGHLIDFVSQIIIDQGFSEFCVDAGRDIRLISDKPIRIGLENPNNFEQAIGVATLSQGSICASAGSRRTWGSFHHIINPHSLTSPSNILATWVITQEALVADALSTSLFLTPASTLIPHFSFEYLILFADNSFEKSSAFPVELFIK
ncbi:MAG: FAD:protein FMN transferase [bacterium]